MRTTGERGPDLDPTGASERLPPAVRHLLPRVSLSRSVTDGMHGDDLHYLGVGASATNVIGAALRLSGSPDPRSILDFGAGAGRVTRWLAAAYPRASISTCDLHEDDVSFCRDIFGATSWISGTDVARLTFPGTYDLIWVGSVLTHLPEPASVALVERLLSVLAEGGHLALSTIGRHARAEQDRSGAFLETGWETVKAGYDGTGYGYVDYPEGEGYGLSLSRVTWAADLATRLPGVRLALLAERVWDQLHDVVVLQRQKAYVPDAPLPDTAARALADIRASNSWRLTAPLRNIVDLARRSLP